MGIIDVRLLRLSTGEGKNLDDAEPVSLASTSFTLVMLVIAGAMALLIGLVGIYGAISYSFSQRTREIGIRMRWALAGRR